MNRLLLVHYNELGLKKGNRDYFENRLCQNISRTLADCGIVSVRRMSGRLLVHFSTDPDLTEIRNRMSSAFGVAYFAAAWAVPQNIENLERQAWLLMEAKNFRSFRIQTKRAEKSFPLTSVQINERVGAYVQSRCGVRVDLENPDLTCWIEIVEKSALIYVDRVAGPGGLPSGTSGKVVVLLSGGIDSPVAAWKMIKRGCKAILVHFHSFPYTNRESQDKAVQIAELLARYQLQSKIYLVPFAEIQRHIMAGTPMDTRVILYRRYMMRLAAAIAHRERARVLVTGDSVGQVASQTIENIDVISRAVDMPILRPLIGDDKLEIIEVAKRIGTYEISIQPDQDCCSLFVPRHPETRAKLDLVEKSESCLDVSDAMKQALASAEVMLKYPAYETRTVR
jgi:thiamine biosynthesis protein ThiI